MEYHIEIHECRLLCKRERFLTIGACPCQSAVFLYSSGHIGAESRGGGIVHCYGSCVIDAHLCAYRLLGTHQCGRQGQIAGRSVIARICKIAFEAGTGRTSTRLNVENTFYVRTRYIKFIARGEIKSFMVGLDIGGIVGYRCTCRGSIATNNGHYVMYLSPFHWRLFSRCLWGLSRIVVAATGCQHEGGYRDWQQAKNLIYLCHCFHFLSVQH